MYDGYKDKEARKEYNKDYIWQYRLRERLKADSLQKFDAETQKLKNDELQSFRQEAIIQGLNFLLEQIPSLTDEQRKTILSEREKMLLKIDEIIQDQSKIFDDMIIKAKIQHSENFDCTFEKIIGEYKEKVASNRN